MVLRRSAQFQPKRQSNGDVFVVVRDFEVVLVECKARTGQLRTAQQRLQDEGWPIVVLRSADEAMAWLRGGQAI
jgi:hypothetical protein